MTPICKLWAAVGNLATAIDGAADFVNQATENGRRNLELPAPVPRLPAPESKEPATAGRLPRR